VHNLNEQIMSGVTFSKLLWWHEFITDLQYYQFAVFVWFTFFSSVTRTQT